MKTNNLENIVTFSTKSVSLLKVKITNNSMIKFYIPLLIITIIFIFNLPYIYVDLLWHDDGMFYYMASDGMKLWKNEFSLFTPLRHYIYSNLMVFVGVPFARGFVVIIMAISSILLYFIYYRVFGIWPRIAAVAALIPNILPSLKSIPVGLNSSYAMWGLLPILISLIIIDNAFKRDNIVSLLLMLLSFLLYFIGLNLVPSTNFLIPIVLFFFLFYYPQRKLMTVIYGIPFLFYGIWKIYQQSIFTHKTPINPTAELIFERIKLFFEMSSFLPFNHSFSIYVTLVLLILGVASLIIFNKDIIQPKFLIQRASYLRLLLVLWPLIWMFSNGLPYIIIRPPFDAQRYAYVFNFGAIFLQIIGLSYIVYIFLQFIKQKRHFAKVLTLVLIIVTLYSGIQRLHHYSYNTNVSKIIRKGIDSLCYAPKTQFIILGERIGYNPHPGHFEMNSGYLRYILRRSDINGLIGPEYYPHDVFSKKNIWFDNMRGLDPYRPVAAFRYINGSLQRIDFLLQVTSTDDAQGERLKWNLYDVSGQKHPLLVSEGKGIESYNEYLSNSALGYLDDQYIAFSPRNIADYFVDQSHAERIMKIEGLISKEYKIENYFTLRNIIVQRTENTDYLQLLVKINNTPKIPFKFSYKLNGKIIPVPIFEFAHEGDQFAINSQSISFNSLNAGIEISFINSGVWPHKTLKIIDEDGNNHLFINVKYLE